MSNIQRTIYSGHLGTCKMLNRPFSILPNSTLNQKFNVHPTEVPAINEYPIIGYLGIGNKGAYYETTTSGYVLTTPTPHLPRHSSLYNFIPFVIRPISDDISSTERMKYRMRVPITIEGTTYVAYYLRALSIGEVIPTVELRNVDGENISATSFSPSLSDLAPEPPVISSVDLNNPNGDYLVSTAKINFTLNQTDINNIMEACSILYGDPRYAVINEIALCSGLDKVLPGTFGTVTSNYVDTIATQVAAFISQYHALTSSSTEVNIQFDLGSTEALLV